MAVVPVSMGVVPVQEEEETKAVALMDSFRTMLSALKARNLLLTEENSKLKKEVQELRAGMEASRQEMGGRLFGQRTMFDELIRSVETLRETLAKKLADKSVRDAATGQPIRVVVAEVVPPSAELARRTVLEDADSDALEKARLLLSGAV